MKIKDLRELSGDDLTAKGRELAEELFRLKFQHGIRPLENPAKLQLIRKDIARVNTVMNAKGTAGAGN
jgi:large subunit ribosomal protein L29